MKRLLMAALVAATLIHPNPANANGRGPCTAERLEVHHGMSSTTRHHRIDALIRCATARWSFSYATAERIADCESSDYPWAQANGNYGTFQIRDWSARVHYWLRGRHWMFPRWANHGRIPRWQEERANVFVAAIWMHRLGTGAWSCA